MTTFELRSYDRHECARLLEVLPWMTTSVSFVLRDMGDLTDDARRQCLKALEPYVIERGTVTEWPGTRLIGDTAELLTCGNVRAVAEVMRQHAASLYAWLSPLPEDPAFYRADGSVLLGTIAHERDVFVTVTGDEERLLRLAGVRLHSAGLLGHVTSIE